MQPQVRPGELRDGLLQTERPVYLRLSGEGLQRRTEFAWIEPAQDGDGAEMVTMQALGQPAKHRLGLVGGDPLDDELTARHAERDLRAVEEQRRCPRDHRLGRGPEGWMPIGIHAELVERDGELDQELAVFPGKRCAFAPRGV